MATIRGRDVTVKIGQDDGPPETFVTIASATVHTFSVNNTEVEVNTKDSGGWRDLFPDGSIKSIAVSMSFLFVDSAEQDQLRTLAESAAPAANFELHDGSGDVLTGEFQVTQYETTGETEGFAQVSVTLASNGIITRS
jgi:TP901-1 family phage major tail protein